MGSAQRGAPDSPVGGKAPGSPSLGWLGQGPEHWDHPLLRGSQPACVESRGEGRQAQALPSHLPGVFLLPTGGFDPGTLWPPSGPLPPGTSLSWPPPSRAPSFLTLDPVTSGCLWGRSARPISPLGASPSLRGAAGPDARSQYPRHTGTQGRPRLSLSPQITPRPLRLPSSPGTCP